MVSLRLESVGDDTSRAFAAMGGPNRRPWCARLSRRDGRLHRSFIRAQVDYSEANSVGSRGVMYCYLLTDGMYEYRYYSSWSHEERKFLCVHQSQKFDAGPDDVETHFNEEDARCQSSPWG